MTTTKLYAYSDNERWRTSMRMWNSDTLRRMDRLVQGETLEVLAGELEEKLAEIKTSYDRDSLDESSHLFSRDRYGHSYPDHNARRAVFNRMNKLSKLIERMTDGTWGPTHVAQLDANGYIDESTVRPWSP